MVKYFAAHCLVKMLNEDYESWDNLKLFIDSTNLYGDSDFLNQGQLSIWQNYKEVCENDSLKLSKNSLASL